MNQNYLDKIRSFEGYTPKAAWDYQQQSNGFGTKARFAGETIGRAEAEHRFRAEIGAAQAAVKRFAPNLDEGAAAALTSLTFNAGPGWMKAGLGEAVKEGDMGAASVIFKKYVKAGGETLPGLVRRREAEAAWFAASERTMTAAMTTPPEAGTSVVAGLRNGAITSRPVSPVGTVTQLMAMLESIRFAALLEPPEPPEKTSKARAV
jgi:lysozyme